MGPLASIAMPPLRHSACPRVGRTCTCAQVSCASPQSNIGHVRGHEALRCPPARESNAHPLPRSYAGIAVATATATTCWWWRLHHEHAAWRRPVSNRGARCGVECRQWSACTMYVLLARSWQWVLHYTTTVQSEGPAHTPHSEFRIPCFKLTSGKPLGCAGVVVTA